MKNNQKRFRFSRKSILLGIVGILLLLWISWWAIFNFIPHPLGNKLEYLGKKSLGGGLFFSDSDPYSEYYYGTDMNMEEIKTYFPKAKYEGPSNGSAYGASYRTDYVDFSLNGRGFAIAYYSNSNAVLQGTSIRKTKKKYVISVTDYDYQTAKDSL